jgi:hypothetical protein
MAGATKSPLYAYLAVLVLLIVASFAASAGSTGFASSQPGFFDILLSFFSPSASPVFRWKVSQNETNSCGNLTGPASYVDVNTTAPGTRICSTFFTTGLGGLNFLNDRDTIEIDLNVTVPYDSLQGTKRALIIATGTAV